MEEHWLVVEKISEGGRAKETQLIEQSKPPAPVEADHRYVRMYNSVLFVQREVSKYVRTLHICRRWSHGTTVHSPHHSHSILFSPQMNLIIELTYTYEYRNEQIGRAHV